MLAQALAARGWQILARNFRWIGTELDIIARRGQSIVAIEVKSRRRWDPHYHRVEDLVPWRKRRSLAHGLTVFVSRRGLTYQHLRVDLALLVFTEGEKEKPMIHYMVDIGPS